VVHLLPAWDHWMLGWKGRALTVPDIHEKNTRQGSGHQTAFADGFAFATWALERRTGSLTVVVKPFEKVPSGARPGLEREAAEIGRFYGVEADLRIER
jgi:hypothetical protein